MKMPTAILASSDKVGIIDLGQGLTELGWRLYCTTGTLRLLHEHDVPARAVAELAGTSEHFGGRAKTLSASVFDGLLLRHNVQDDITYAEEHGVIPIGLVACTFSPFREGGAQSIDLVDVGGPAMVRAAAKNYQWVVPLVDPADYQNVVAQMAAGGVPGPQRRALAAKAFRATEAYDRAVAMYLANAARGESGDADGI